MVLMYHDWSKELFVFIVLFFYCRLGKETMESGLIEIISSPPASFFPDRSKLRVTYDDPLHRVKWRIKMNLDYAFLM